jgi:glutamyl-tRNA reductase
MELLCIGLSHKSAPLQVREKLALPWEEQERLLDSVAAPSSEAMILSTCNRVEFYLVSVAVDTAKESLISAIASVAGPESLPHLYEHRGDGALVHLFRVSASLDSMVVGEAQILGQVKDAFELAQKRGTARGELARICSAAFSTAKRVRSETGLGRGPVSMASAAVELAEKIFGALDGRCVLMVGAGELAELATKRLRSAGSKVIIANRTLEHAQSLASAIGAEARSLEDMPALLVWADILICSTASRKPLFTRENVSPVLKARRFRPLFMVDLSVPRDIDPEVHQLDGVYAYNVDDIQKVVSDTAQARGAEADKAEAIIAEEIAEFVRARSVRYAVPVVAQLRARAEEIARTELQKTLSNFDNTLTEKQRRSIESMATAIINKLLHQPTAKLRAIEPKAGSNPLAGAAAELFGLETPSPTGWTDEPGAPAVSAREPVVKGSKR